MLAGFLLGATVFAAGVVFGAAMKTTLKKVDDV